MSSTKTQYTHTPGMFKVGERVKVNLKVQEAQNWGDNWGDSQMDDTVGKTGEVIAEGSSGVKVRFEGGRAWFYPSCSLQREGNVTSATPDAPAASQNKTSKRRVRVKPGPWDAAPCTHLRWQLMGFFREKLAFVNAKTIVNLPDGTRLEVPFTQVEVACTRCDTKMTLKAK